jgi:aldehyde:ferredoxin oxidoreductase
MSNLGYMGKVLRIDLSNGTSEVDTLDMDTKKQYLGGRGLGIWLLAKETDPKVDPYSEDNPLIFMTGPYTGTGVFSGFFNVTAKSPLTGLAAASHSGGRWGPGLKRSGYDALIIIGKAARPCYVLIDNGTCRILDAQDLWGSGVRNTTAVLQNRHGKVGVAAIGPAGENLVRLAAIMNDLHRTAARGGVGAVMGSKNLKAVMVGGSQRIHYADRDRFMELSRTGGKKSLKNAPAFAKYGTTMVLAMMNALGTLPSYYFKKGAFEYADQINGEAMKSRYWVRDNGCFNCPLKCANIHTIPHGPFAVAETEGPEYESMMALGSSCGNASVECLIKTNDMCNDLGMDTISAGACMALLFYLYDQGIIKNDMGDGMDLSWGNPDTMMKLLTMMAYRHGIGEVLAEGSTNAANYLAKDGRKYVIETKMQDFPAYEVRRAHGTGLSFATSNRGACHLRAAMYVPELFAREIDQYGFGPQKVDLLITKENFLTLIDSLVMCKFGQRNGEFTAEVLAEMLNSLTGAAYTAHDLTQIGERTYNLERIYNLAAGIGPDVLPERLFEEDLDDGLTGGTRISRAEFAEAIQLYYQKRGWDEAGRPTPARLRELGMEEFQDLCLAPPL